MAVRNGNIQIVNILLTAGAEVDRQSTKGQTALHMAVRGKSVRITNLLLAAGADVNKPSTKGTRPLHYAVRKRNTRMLEILLVSKYGADVDAKTAQGTTPIIDAAKIGFIDGINVLLRHGANDDHIDKHGFF